MINGLFLFFVFLLPTLIVQSIYGLTSNQLQHNFFQPYLKEGSDPSNMLKVPQISFSETSQNFEFKILSIYHRVPKTSKLTKM